MSVHRFYLSPEKSRGNRIWVEEEEARHALQVLRLNQGDLVDLITGEGEILHARIQEVQKRKFAAEILNREQRPAPPCPITLFQAIPKARLIESIIQKATELGVRRVVPLLTERVLTQLDEKDRTQKQEKWQVVAIEAAKQCGQAWLPHVEKPCSLGEALKKLPPIPFSLVGSLQPGSQHPRTFMKAYVERHGHAPAGMGLFVGPEGDFTEKEIETLLQHGVHPITMGPLVLRVETAAIYGISVMQYELASGLM